MSYTVETKELSGLMRQTFENMQAPDIKATVLPNFEKNFGGVDGLLAKVEVDRNIGVRSSQVELRRKSFGINKVDEEPQEPLWKLMWEALQDPTLIFLCAAACFSLLIALFVEQRPYGWLEGVAILTAVAVVVLVGSINDYQKEMQFRELNSKKEDLQLTVLRDGHLTQISTFDLVVGDIVILSTGDLIPADGVVLGRNDLEISEKMLTGETCLRKKSPSYVLSGNEVVSSPTLFAGTYVQAGEGKMLVLAVGVSTYQGSMEQKMKETESGRSILQKKLDAMTDLITSVSMNVSILLVVILSLRMGYGFYAGKCCMESWKHDVHWSELLGFIITGITIFVVAVPEGERARCFRCTHATASRLLTY
jgi:P-type Ca2+ transporter type 2C